ncbi:hypothetical protein CALVIDRAFT_544858 [Calocera viscosa TUFC12733]|uniref:DDE-1 domain-containing protein n=1 Tax=Calocera viscosa (strain TUFC12733) TaxID=1330018 RepID=A0A167P1V7_CALVF|nr:hypothetical protein CALVIDRAFT_544858 [Calocera viscosa TUFC12733]
MAATLSSHRNVRKLLGWCLRRATKAAHKLPDNFQQLLIKAALRAAYTIQHYYIPAACIVNSDETQLLLQHGGDCSYAPIGAHQVDVLGKEEKRACTIMTSLAMDGTLLPFQSIWKGVTNRSLPFSNDRSHSGLREALEQGHIFTLSHSATYWTNQRTLQVFVTDLLAPYFKKQNRMHNRPSHATCLWVIDVYSVHRSEDFRSWIQDSYPWILLNYIPAGCTGVWQPADVGLQRRLKRSIRQAALADVADETLDQLQAGCAPSAVVLDTSLPRLRNRTVSWLIKAYHELNQPEIVQQAWHFN